MSYPGKRVLDLAISVPLFILSLPVQAAAAVAIRLTLGSPVLFEQSRPGKDGVPFTMHKFRTMHPVNEQRGWTDDASRLTRLGSAIRSSSIDELPTIWNIIRGEMSIVGPRPLLLSYIDRYTAEQKRRMEVLPGLTGLAQVSGRNAQSWDERFAHDLHYVDNCSLSLDMTILFRTIKTVLSREGISAVGQATMPEFRGTRSSHDRSQ